MKSFVFCFLLIISTAVSAQELSAKLKSKTPLKKVEFVGVDKYENTYTIHNDVFHKTGENDFQFSDIQLGELTSADILNPLKIVLFYESMNTVVLLDDKLNEINRINFNTLPNFRNVGFATKANQNNLWIFNMDLQELELFDYKNQKVVAHTQPLDDEIVQQQSNFNFCWLLTKSKLKRYNSYGSFIDEYPVDDSTKISNHNQRLMALHDKKLSILLKGETDFHPISMPEIAIKDFYLTGENLYLYDGDFLYHFHLNLPN